MLLNTTVEFTFTDPDNPQEFLNYLNDVLNCDVKGEDFVSREYFYQFLEFKISRTPRFSQYVHFIREDVLSVKKISSHPQKGFLLKTALQTQAYDACILCCGQNLKKISPNQFSSSIISPYPASALNQFRDEKLLIIGSGLASIDVLVHLSKNHFRGEIDLLTRSAALPSVKKRDPALQVPEFAAFLADHNKGTSSGYEKLNSLVRAIDSYCQKKGSSLSYFQNYKPSLTDQLHYDYDLCRSAHNIWEDIIVDIIYALNNIWPDLTNREKDYFHTDIEPWLGRLLDAMPLKSADAILKLAENVPIQFVSHEKATQTHYSAIINATGLDKPSTSIFLQSLAQDGLLSFNHAGGVKTCPQTGRTKTALHLYSCGAINRGESYTSGSIYWTALTAQKISQTLLSR
ncbi:SidA/IucD/PvdA family monooxygenase [Aristophania vespae]|uniref:SidA/IucD/PvdA family monooxygenase n=1 Tax=Aristophania vespae TaxID=2697033 RepID=A0A6P1NE41_9PROT|nr:FAD/NAD(P)-binding protein [Aristophania vespae]QHI95167.1 SidA/IucD/PvdA family monooxygenase [Aristophania vespae]